MIDMVTRLRRRVVVLSALSGLSVLSAALFCMVPILAVGTLSSGLLSAGPRSGGLLFTQAAGATGSQYPVTIHAANGTVKVPSRPTAIVSLSPTATEMLYAIGAGAQVKAVDEFSDYPKNAPRTQLDGNDPNVEAIATYKPDLVVESGEAPTLAKQLSVLGIPVLDNPPASNLSQEYAQFGELGKATGHSAQAAAEVSKIKGQIDQIVRSVHKRAHPQTYYYELDQTYYSATSSTFIGQVLSLLGLRSIADAAKGAASTGGYPQLSGEFVLKSNPDYILLADTICCAQSAATAAARPGWSNLSAVKNGRVLALNDDIASRWGPRIVTLLSEVAAEVRQHPIPGSNS
jgi:iron complex transport system substrate-binding protein